MKTENDEKIRKKNDVLSYGNATAWTVENKRKALALTNILLFLFETKTGT